MTYPKLSRLRPFAASVLTAALSLLAGASARAQLTTVYAFTNTTDGFNPRSAPLTIGSDGNLYGTVPYGGTGKYGTAYQLTPGGVFTVLHNFSDGPGGGLPDSGLLEGAPGTFYGTTGNGGDSNNDGTAFSLTSGGAFAILHTFSEYPDGTGPTGTTLVRDAAGNLYGATGTGGPGTLDSGMDIFGTIYQITPGGGFSVIFPFNDDANGGGGESLTLGADGNLYGTTQVAGANETGTIFRMTTGGGITTLYSFAANAQFTTSQIAHGNDGNLYGTLGTGGANGTGMVFEITAAGTFMDLYDFSVLAKSEGAQNADGGDPIGIVQGSDGNLYGTASGGGTYGFGTLYRLTTAGAFTTLYSFQNGPDGSQPESPLVEDGNNNLYGTTSAGGSASGGTIFKYSLNVGVQPGAPTVTVAVSGDGQAVVGGETGKVKFTRTGSTSAALAVSYQLKGSPQNGTDYKKLSGTITIPAGAASAKLKIKPVAGAPDTGTSKIKVKLRPSADGTYARGSATVAKITFVNNG